MSNPQNAGRIQQIRTALETYDTQDLLEIWKTNNRREWAPEAFAAIREILLARLGSVPPQQERDPREAAAPVGKKLRLLPSRLEGEIEFKYLSAEDARRMLGRFTAALAAQHATHVHSSEHKVTFDADLILFVPNRNLLQPVDEGEITVSPGAPGSVKYRFSLVRWLVISLFMTLAAFFFLMLAVWPNTPAQIFLVPVIFWLLLFGGNYFIVLLRLQNFMWKIVSY